MIRFAALLFLAACTNAPDVPMGSPDGSMGSVDAATAPDAPRTADGSFDAGPAPVPNSCVDTACAFPGAEGFGTGTSAGRGGRVLVVTTLASDGPGSLRAALETTGPRIVVFRVSGVIDLEGSTLELLNEHSELTVLGQTSPGGITITGADTLLSAYHQDLHDVVLRFLRFRGPAYDTISFNTVDSVVVDHCDFSAGTDETFDITYGTNITVQWSTVTNSVAGEGSQNYGTLLAYEPTTNISWHHNLQAHHYGRCLPHMHWAGDGSGPAGGANVDVRNNVVYNCGTQDAMYASEYPDTGVNWNWVGNFAKVGPDSPAGSYIANIADNIFAEDNVFEGVDYDGLVFHEYGAWDPVSAPFDFPAVTTTSAAEAYEAVLGFAGAWPRDAMNERTVAEVRSGTGTLGKTDDALSTDDPTPPQDADLDGLPDDWEAEHGLSSSDPGDSAGLDEATGYAWIEVYANERANEIVGR
jgi:hypothetical protein